MPTPIPVTAAGGIRATAIATPTIISGIAVINASPPAIPSKIATMMVTGRSSVLDCISAVISIGITIDNASVMTAANNIDEETSFAPKISDCLISFLLPRTEFNAIEEIGPTRGDISICYFSCSFSLSIL